MTSLFLEGESRIALTELAKRVERHLSTVHRWRQSGALQCYRMGGRWLVTREAWNQFLARCNPEIPDISTRSLEKQRERYLAAVRQECEAVGI